MADKLFENVSPIGNKMVFKHIHAGPEDNLRKLGDLFIDKFKNGIVLITQEKGGKLAVLLKVAKSNKSINCSEILKSVMGEFNGKGGGKADMSQGSVDISHKKEFAKRVEAILT